MAYEDTLSEALTALFGQDASTKEPNGDGDKEPTTDPNGTGTTELTQEELVTQAADAYEAAIAAQKKGDWAKYGQHMNELESYLNKLAG